MPKKALSVITLTLFLTGILNSTLKIRQVKSQKTWIVDDDGPADFHSIQEAINAASDGDIILVYNGTYYENIVVNKAVSLIGEDKSNTIIDGNGTLTEMGVVSLQGVNSSIRGFTIRNGGYGIKVFSSYGHLPKFTGHIIEDNCIINNSYGGIFLQTCANNTISNNIVANNTLFGIHLCHAGNNTLINNTVVNNGHGIDFYGNSNDNVLRNNNMTNNSYNFGLILRGETQQFLRGFKKPGIVNDVDTSNTVNGKPIYYLVNKSNFQIPPNAGYVWLNNCTNITVNGCKLSHNLQGLMLLFCKNASIINNNITNNVYGAFISVFSSNNRLIGNRFENNLNGIFFDAFTKRTTMRNNVISGGNVNFGFRPDIGRYIDSFSDLENDIDTSNTVDGKPIIYWVNRQNQTVPKNAGYVMLINSSNILVESLNLSNNLQGIYLLGSNNITIANNTIRGSIYGIDIDILSWIEWIEHELIRHRICSSDITIKENIILNNGVGIFIRGDNSTIYNNTLYRNPLGILADVNNSTVSRNMITESNLSTTDHGPDLLIFYYQERMWEYSVELMRMEIGGIVLGGGHNVIYGNTVKDSQYGLVMFDGVRYMCGFENLVFHNNFINNTYQAIGPFAPERNYYDNGYPSGGNYWSNYDGLDLYSGLYQNETGSDGVGDTPFIAFSALELDVTDNYPLMAPIEIFNIDENVFEIVSNSHLSHFNLSIEQKILSFNVTGVDGQAGFCRITIPNTIIQNLWHGNYTVYFDDEPVPFRSWKDQENTYIYINYTHSEHKIMVVSEFPSVIILPSLMIVTMLIVVYVKKNKGKL
ncbi:MAG: right-handed parallel beta-helix repeat-containing protein [Candidatus Bathyarchaeia archaeon]